MEIKMKIKMKINLEDIPSYLKNSEVYKNLTSKNIKYIFSETTTFHSTQFAHSNPFTIPLYKINDNPKDLTLNNWTNMLKTIYFWKLKDIPIEFFIYIHYNLNKSLNLVLKKYNNNLTKWLLTFEFDDKFLSKIIASGPTELCSENTKFDLLVYIIQNNIKEINNISLQLCQVGNTKMVKYILSNTCNLDKDSMITLSAKYGHLELVKLLIDFYGVDILHYFYDLPLRVAGENGHVDVFKYLINLCGTKYISEFNEELLRHSASKGHYQIVQILLEIGVNIHARNNEALNNAVKNGNFDTVKILLKYGANINDIYHTLWYAVENNHPNIIKLILEHSIIINKKYRKYEISAMCDKCKINHYLKCNEILNEYLIKYAKD